MKTKGIVIVEQISNFRKKKNYKLTKQEFNEIALREMLISCFVYGTINENTYSHTKYILPYKATVKAFNEIYNEMKISFEKCGITYNVYTDSDECTYNSITY